MTETLSSVVAGRRHAASDPFELRSPHPASCLPTFRLRDPRPWTRP